MEEEVIKIKMSWMIEFQYVVRDTVDGSDMLD